MIYQLLFGVLLLVTGSYGRARIVGGTKVADRTAFAYQASLRYGGSHFCGGTIVGDYTILTAAHCNFDQFGNRLPLTGLSVVLGTLRLQEAGAAYKVKAVDIHPQYDPTGYDFDIAYWTLSTKIAPSSKVAAIALSPKTPADGANSTVSGWGTTYFSQTAPLSSDLLYVNLPIGNFQACSKAYAGYDVGLTGNMICAGEAGKDSCQGDSGGPLVVNNQVAGVVSFGIGCAYPGILGVYTDVSKFGDFLAEIQ